MSKERWETILKCYHAFLQNNEVPNNHLAVNAEVLQSWIRSRRYGVDPYDEQVLGKRPRLNEFSRVISNNNMLMIDVTKSQINKLSEVLTFDGCELYLFDKNGILLLARGAEMTSMREEGVSYNENDIGTNAHILSMRLKRPVQLQGPEHYCRGLHNKVASAAPILDENDKPLGALVLLSQLPSNQPWEASNQQRCVYYMAMVSAVAVAIETQIKFRHSCQMAKWNNKQNMISSNIAKYTFEDIIGYSKEIKHAIDLGRLFAKSQKNILLVGESGTGKELFAQAIHNASRPQGPFVALNCSAMPKELIGSELFGYEGGSFTGAERSGRPGKMELADGGTLFLDEIGDMPLELQAVLLRALEDKQIMRVGGQRYKKVDFRVIAATNKNLAKMVRENTFREDLYYRLSVLTIVIPPLRERGNDVFVLSEYFVDRCCRQAGRRILQISPATRKKIMEYDWPGNVRQLKNAITYAVTTTRNCIIEPDNLPGYVVLSKSSFSKSEAKMQNLVSLRSWEKAGIENALLLTNNRVKLAAELLDISRSTMYRKLREYNIRVEESSGVKSK